MYSLNQTTYDRSSRASNIKGVLGGEESPLRGYHFPGEDIFRHWILWISLTGRRTSQKWLKSKHSWQYRRSLEDLPKPLSFNFGIMTSNKRRNPSWPKAVQYLNQATHWQIASLWQSKTYGILSRILVEKRSNYSNGQMAPLAIVTLCFSHKDFNDFTVGLSVVVQSLVQWFLNRRGRCTYLHVVQKAKSHGDALQARPTPQPRTTNGRIVWTEREQNVQLVQSSLNSTNRLRTTDYCEADMHFVDICYASPQTSLYRL